MFIAAVIDLNEIEATLLMQAALSDQKSTFADRRTTNDTLNRSNTHGIKSPARNMSIFEKKEIKISLG